MMMNFLLTSHKQKALQNGSMYSCSYCHRVFNSFQALGAHLKAHRNMLRKYQNYQNCDNTIDGNYDKNDTEWILYSFLSNATNCSASSRALALSGGLTPSARPLGRPLHFGCPNNPLDLASCGGSIGFCQFNVDVLRYFINRFPYLSKCLLYILKNHNHHYHPYSSCVTCSLFPCHIMNIFFKFRDFMYHPVRDIAKHLGMKDPVFAGLLPPPQAQLGSSFCPSDNIRGLTTGRVKKRFLCNAAANAVMRRAPKRLRVRSSWHACWVEEPPHHELLLFKDARNSFSASEKDEANLDLSLHL